MAHAAGDSHEYPVYGYHFRAVFPIRDINGDLITGATGLDSEVSIDQGTAADCTNEAIEIATATGMYYLDFTGAEVTGKSVFAKTQSTTTDSKDALIALYPRRLPVMEIGTAQAGGTSTITLATSSATGDEFYGGLFVGITNDVPSGVENQLRRIISYDGTTQIATVDSPWGTNPSSSSTYEILIPEGYATTTWGGVTQTPGDIVAQIGNIASTSSGGFPTAAETDNTGGAIKGVSVVGTPTGTYTNTEAEDGVYHTMSDAANAIDIIYQFDVTGGRTAVEVGFKGYLNSANDVITAQAYDYVGTTWDTRAVISGQGGATNISQNFTLLSKHTGVTGADTGKVLIRFTTTGQSSPTLNTDELLVTAANLGQSVGYQGGAVWIDEVNGNPGVVSFVNGTADNPVDNLADAITIAGNISLIHFQVSGGSTIQFLETHTNEIWQGDNWILDLNTQSISGSVISGANVSGVCTGASPPRFERCIFAATTVPPCKINGGSGFTDTLTFGSAGNFDILDCASLVAGTGTPTVDLGAAIGGSNVSIRGWAGGLTFNNILTGDAISLEGLGGTITANGTGGSINVRGIFEHMVDNSSAAVTVDLHALINRESSSAYADGVWIDTNSGNTGILDYVDGTADKPVGSIADAYTVAASIGISAFRIAPGSSITLPTSSSSKTFHGTGYTVVLNSTNIASTTISGAAISGTATGSGAVLDHCQVGAVTLANGKMQHCSLGDTITMSTAGDYAFFDCYSSIAGTGTPSIDFGAVVGSSNLSMRHYSGGIEIQNIGQTGTDLASIEGNGQIILNANCAGGTIAIRGNFTVTDNAGGVVTLSDNARFDIDQPLNMGKINESALAASNLGKTASNMVPGTVDTTNFSATTTEFEADDITTAAPDHYNGRIIIFVSDVGGILKFQATAIEDYSLATGRGHFTVTALTSAPGNNDTFIIV